MGLSKLVLGIVLAGVGCAAMPKPVCDYQQKRGSCVSEYGNALVTYLVKTDNVKGIIISVCRINALYPEDKLGFQVLDTGCDGITELYEEYKMQGDSSVTTSMAHRAPDNEKLFLEYDQLFRDEVFQELKNKVLGGDKDGSK